MQKVLLVEDDTTYALMLQKWFERNQYAVHYCSRYDSAQADFQKEDFDLVLTDLRLPDGDGIMLLTWIKERKPSLPVLLMTSYAEVQTAVLSIKLGAFDYLEKPIRPEDLKQKIAQALRPVADEGVAVSRPKPSPSGSRLERVEGHTPYAQQMKQHIALVAPTRMSVLILGESGTGKEYAARQIHELSALSEGPFVAVDCGSLSRELAPSELFGHLKGSFTSAVGDKKGVFEQAHGGTVFLDEIGNLHYDVQVQLLRALQEQKIRPVGSAVDIPVQVRLIAATNENLEHQIAEGKFREDLYHRLNEFSLFVPALRDRVEDIPLFARHFLLQANVELGKALTGFTAEALKALQNNRWSGNLRELRNAVRRAALFAQGEEIGLEHLPLFSKDSVVAEKADLSLRPTDEKEQIEKALQQARGNKTEAARLLKIDRKTLYNKMHHYGLPLSEDK